MTTTPQPQVDIEELENVIKQALPMTMRNESPCEARVALRAIIAEVRALRELKLAVRCRAVMVNAAHRTMPGDVFSDMREIERITR